MRAAVFTAMPTVARLGQGGRPGVDPMRTHTSCRAATGAPADRAECDSGGERARGVVERGEELVARASNSWPPASRTLARMIPRTSRSTFA